MFSLSDSSRPSIETCCIICKRQQKYKYESVLNGALVAEDGGAGLFDCAGVYEFNQPF